MVIRMIKSDLKSSEIPDSTSERKPGTVFDIIGTGESKDTDVMVRSVSALKGHNKNEPDVKSQNLLPQGVPIKSFDSLIKHMEALNVKFLN